MAIRRSKPGKWLSPRRFWHLVVEAALILVLLLVLEAWLTRDAAHGTAPEISAIAITPQATVDGARLVYFWGTWCPVCRAQQGAINTLVKDTPLLSVAMQSGDMHEVESYLQEHQLHWPTVADEHGEIARQWGVRGVPAIFVIDRQNEIRFVTRGYTSAWGLRLRLWWAGR
ncbi:MAG: protein disulfide oxidoreductase [Thiohalomonadaceae bacterium]